MAEDTITLDEMKREKEELLIKCRKIAKDRAKENQITPDLNYEEFIERFNNVVSIYWCTSSPNEIWNYFFSIENNISDNYKLKFILKDLYTNYPISDLVKFYSSLALAKENETDESKSERYKDNYKVLHDLMDNNGNIKIYRGVSQKSLPLTLAISWTYDPDAAKFFAIRFGNRAKKIIKAEVNVKDILFCHTDRNESEVIIDSYYKLFNQEIIPIHIAADKIEQWCSEWHKNNKAS